VRVAWDAPKNLANQRKHGLAFEEVARLFSSGVEYLIVFDEAHSFDEDRFIAIGPIDSGLVVGVWVEEDEDVIRIISARRATVRERRLYGQYAGGRR
jgi:uncharacterized DUF497 family protein